MTGRVLLVDDSDIIRSRVRASLSSIAGVEIVAEATDADSALRELSHRQPDIMVLDLMLPGGGGTRVLERMARSKDRPVVIVFTNFPYPEYRTRCAELGAHYFFDKTADHERLPKLIRRLVNGGTDGSKPRGFTA
jgi:DNA-binding NarL/FixJ family response regulator